MNYYYKYLKYKKKYINLKFIQKKKKLDQPLIYGGGVKTLDIYDKCIPIISTNIIKKTNENHLIRLLENINEIYNDIIEHNINDGVTIIDKYTYIYITFICVITAIINNIEKILQDIFDTSTKDKKNTSTIDTKYTIITYKPRIQSKLGDSYCCQIEATFNQIHEFIDVIINSVSNTDTLSRFICEWLFTYYEDLLKKVIQIITNDELETLNNLLDKSLITIDDNIKFDDNNNDWLCKCSINNFLDKTKLNDDEKKSLETIIYKLDNNTIITKYEIIKFVQINNIHNILFKIICIILDNKS